MQKGKWQIMVDKRVKNGRIGDGVGFDRIRRITGYLVGSTERWNNAKLAELKDRKPSKTENK